MNFQNYASLKIGVFPSLRHNEREGNDAANFVCHSVRAQNDGMTENGPFRGEDNQF